jgi:hypothetical protein
MLRNGRSNERKKGFALIYVTLIGTFVLIPMAGLAIDFGMLYNIKARLQTAVDAAAIGAGYMLHASTNLSDPTQLAAITTAAQNYFNANYPTHYFGSTVSTYTATVATSTSGKTITVNATATVPMLLMRVLGIKNSQVAAVAVSNVRYIAMMIVVDRSGSISAEGAAATIQSALTTFVATSSTSYLVNGVDTVGMISFGATWKMDFAPTTSFQTGSPNIGTAINDIYFGDSGTNTAEGLYQAWTELHQMNLPGSLNVIVLLTDGRPSGFTGSFSTASPCNSGHPIKGVIQAYVNEGSGYPWWPPPTTGSTNVFGLLYTQLTGSYPNWVAETSAPATPDAGCQYLSNQQNVSNDLSGQNFPSTVGPVDNVGASFNSSYPYYTTPGAGVPTQTGYYQAAASGNYQGGNAPGQSATDPQSVRYAAFNAASNMASYIRQDTTLSPMLFVIGLNYSDEVTEPLDADWLASLANDPNYVNVGSDTNVIGSGYSVYNKTQTPGMYCNSTPATLQVCFQQVTSQLLRLVQ